jgi:hypothetical protein
MEPVPEGFGVSASTPTSSNSAPAAIVPEGYSASASTPRTSHPGIHHRRAIRYIKDIKTPDLETPRRRRNCLSVMRYENQVKERRIKTLQKHNRRLKMKVRNLKDVLLKFQKENLLTDDKMTELVSFFQK